MEQLPIVYYTTPIGIVAMCSFGDDERYFLPRFDVSNKELRKLEKQFLRKYKPTFYSEADIEAYLYTTVVESFCKSNVTFSFGAYAKDHAVIQLSISNGFASIAYLFGDGIEYTTTNDIVYIQPAITKADFRPKINKIEACLFINHTFHFTDKRVQLEQMNKILKNHALLYPEATY